MSDVPPSPPPWLLALPAEERSLFVLHLRGAIRARLQMTQDVAVAELEGRLAATDAPGEAIAAFRGQADSARRLADAYLEIAEELEAIVALLEKHAEP